MRNYMPVQQTVRNLPPDARRAVERLLGRGLDEDEEVTITVRPPLNIIKPAPTGAERDEAFRLFIEQSNEISKRLENVPDEELEALIDEAYDVVHHHKNADSR